MNMFQFYFLISNCFVTLDYIKYFVVEVENHKERNLKFFKLIGIVNTYTKFVRTMGGKMDALTIKDSWHMTTK